MYTHAHCINMTCHKLVIQPSIQETRNRPGFEETTAIREKLCCIGDAMCEKKTVFKTAFL